MAKNNDWVIKILVGFLFTISFAGITGLAAEVRTNEKEGVVRDKESVTRDVEINDKLNTSVIKQLEQNEVIKVQMAEILTQLKYMNNGRTH